MGVSARISYLVLSDFERLEDWCRMVRIVFGRPPYLVGSVISRADYRDVDVRVVLPDKQFDALCRGRLDSIRFLNRGISVWGQQETGLPIDFQVQRRTEAEAEFADHVGVPMGVRDWTVIPTSGVPSGHQVPMEDPDEGIDDGWAEAKEVTP